MVTVNFAEVPDSDFSAIPPGKYHVKITGGEMRETGPNSKNPGAQYINWELTVQEGEQENRKLWTNTSLLPHALFSLKGLLLAAGVVEADAARESLDFEIADLVSKSVVVTVGAREFQGETRAEVKRFMPYNPNKFQASKKAELLP